MGLYQAHLFKTRHLELGFLTYVLEAMPKGAFLTMDNTLGSPSPLPFLPFTHLAHQGTLSINRVSCLMYFHRDFEYSKETLLE